MRYTIPKVIFWLAPLLLAGQLALAGTTQVTVANKTGFTCAENDTDYPSGCKATPETGISITFYGDQKGTKVLGTLASGDKKSFPAQPVPESGKTQIFFKRNGGDDQNIWGRVFRADEQKSLYFYKLDTGYENFTNGCKVTLSGRCAPGSK